MIFNNTINSTMPVGAITAFCGSLSSDTSNRLYQPSDAQQARAELMALNQSIQSATATPQQTQQQAELNNILIESAGWLLCDGRYLYIAQCPELFYVLGNLYDTAAQEGTFSIPDYRGAFLRAVDYGVGVDPDANERQAADRSGTQQDGVGSLQSDALQQHQHNYQATAMASSSSPNQPASIVGQELPTTDPIAPARTSSETRPVNIAVNYLIRYRP